MNISEFSLAMLNKVNNLYLPRLIILDITHSCNLKCRICDIWKTGISEKDIDIYHVQRVLDQAKKLGINEIALSGGEPLIRKDIYEIFDYARNINIKNLGVLTNGIMIAENINRLEPYILDNTISLVFSLDSLKADTHNYIRNYDNAWKKTVEGLGVLSCLKKSNSQVKFNVITIILNHNLEELADIAAFVESLGADSLQFQALLPNNLRMNERKKSEFWVLKDRLNILDDSLSKLIELKKEKPDFIKNSITNLLLMRDYYCNRLLPENAKCLSADRTILVANDGKCRTCFSVYGSLKNTLLKDVLMSKEIIQARNQVKRCAWPCLLPCFCDDV